MLMDAQSMILKADLKLSDDMYYIEIICIKEDDNHQRCYTNRKLIF